MSLDDRTRLDGSFAQWRRLSNGGVCFEETDGVLVNLGLLLQVQLVEVFRQRILQMLKRALLSGVQLRHRTWYTGFRCRCGQVFRRLRVIGDKMLCKYPYLGILRALSGELARLALELVGATSGHDEVCRRHGSIGLVRAGRREYGADGECEANARGNRDETFHDDLR
jgi:hypothetical protein